MSVDLPQSATISIAEAAAVLGVSRSSAYRMAEAGDLPTITLGLRTRRVPTTTFLQKFGLVPV
jgi:excisionase family DNA binding protein